jgi:hypothetical protein
VSIFTPDDRVRTGRAWTYGCLSAVLLFVVLPLALWAFGVFSSGPRGKADVIKQRNSAPNLIAQNTTLNNDSQVVIADKQKIQSMAAIPTGQQTQQDVMDLQGAEQVCDTDVATYNAAAANILAQGQLPAGLPQTYDASTECEPS